MLKDKFFLKFSLLYENMTWSFLCKTWPYAWNQNIFLKKFWRKSGILIQDLYFYDVKIQTTIKQNLVEEYAEESQIFKNIYIFWIFFGPGRTRPAHFGLGQTCLA